MSQAEHRATPSDIIQDDHDTAQMMGEGVRNAPLSSTIEQSVDAKRPQQQVRLLFIDNLRILLTTLVIMHHLAITYGAAGSWYYQDPAKDKLTTVLLTILVASNQAFFMGFFFLISAYFTPASYQKKGVGTFLKDRLLRLGIPLVVYQLVLNPLVIYIAQGSKQPYLNLWGLYLLNLRSIGDGPLWFVETLLIFACLYAFWRWLIPRSNIGQQEDGRLPRSWQVLLFLVGLATVTFVVRIWLPVGWTFQPLNLQFPFFPQYIALYILGIVAYRYNWFSRIASAMGRLWLWIGIVTILLFLPIVLISSGGVPRSLDAFVGGLHWQAFIYALWEEFVCMGLCIGLLVLFRRRFNRQRALGKFMSANAYTVYIIHPVIIVSLAVVLQGVHIYPLLKYCIAVLIAVPLCFLVSHLIRQIPYAKRIL